MKLRFKIPAKFFIPAICMGIVGMIQHCANADALWAKIDGNEIHVALSKKPGEAGIKSAKVQKSIVTAGDKTLTLNQQNNKSYLTATLPPSTNLMGVSNDWGEIQSNEPGGGEYHLRYYAKAARTLKDAASSVDAEAQWYVRYGYGQVVAPLSYWGSESNNPDIPIFARLMKDGQPVAHAQVKIYDSKDTSHPERKMTDASGSITFYVRGKNLYGLQAYWTNLALQDNKYISEHYSASLTFPVDEEVIQQRLSKTWIDDTDEKIADSYVSDVSDMRFSSNSEKLISSGRLIMDGEKDKWGNQMWDKRLRVWDVKTGNDVWKLPAAPASPENTVIMPDFKTIYTQGNGGYNEIDIHSFRFKRLLKNNNGYRASIELSPDGKLFAIGATREVDFVDTKTLKTIRTYKHGGQGAEVFWGPDSKTLLMEAWGSKPQAVDVATAKQIHYPRWVYRIWGSSAFAFSPSGKYLAKAMGQRIEIWTTPTEDDAGQMLNAFATRLDLVHVLQFSPDGKTLAVGGSSKTEVPVQFIKLSQVRK